MSFGQGLPLPPWEAAEKNYLISLTFPALLVGLGGTCGMQGVEPRSAACEAKALPLLDSRSCPVFVLFCLTWVFPRFQFARDRCLVNSWSVVLKRTFSFPLRLVLFRFHIPS